jgi:hypothetical protein
VTVYVAVPDFVMVVGVPFADEAFEIVIVLVANGQVLKVVRYVPVDPEFEVTVKFVVEIIVEIDVGAEAGTEYDAVVVIVSVVVVACGANIINGPLFPVLPVRFIRMRKQIHDCNTAVMEV